MDIELKRAIKNYQGKYFKGQELEGQLTYVFIRKVVSVISLDPERIYTFADVLGYNNHNLVFWQNRTWYFGNKYIRVFRYKKIKKSEFIKAITGFGFENKKPKDFAAHKYERKRSL